MFGKSILFGVNFPIVILCLELVCFDIGFKFDFSKEEIRPWVHASVSMLIISMLTLTLLTARTFLQFQVRSVTVNSCSLGSGYPSD